MAARPLIQKKTAELTQLFEEWKHLPTKLRTLKRELEYRRTSKARLLLEQVNQILNNIAPSPSSQHISPTIQCRTEPTPTSVSTDTSQSLASNSHHPPTTTFTIVQPIGTSPRPTAYRPSLKRNLILDISDADPAVTVFRGALSELISEMRSRRVGLQQFTLKNGARVSTDNIGYSYQFAFTEEANVFDGASVDIIINTNTAKAILTALLPGHIVITFSDDYGESISRCVLRIDETTLLQSLHDRLASIESGQVADFQTAIAQRLLDNAGEVRPGIHVDTWPWPQAPNREQRLFVELALSNDITWLWGPPGTGKTDTLSALTKLLHIQDKRILICSNTNRAVDQLLQKLCRNLISSQAPELAEGKIIRIGRLDEELICEFGDYLIPERIAARKSKDAIETKALIESELVSLNNAIAHSRDVLLALVPLERAIDAVSSAKQRLAARGFMPLSGR